MDLSKSYEYFKPPIDGRIHIVGCGSVGSTVAENLCRMGIKKFTLWDFDKVEAKNIVNQMFLADQVGMLKVDALADILKSINPDVELTLKPEGWQGEKLSGHVFLAVDNIDIRRDLLEKNQSGFMKSVFDFRTELESAQHYAADWTSLKQREFLLGTMDFSHEEASKSEALSACGITLGVAPTVRTVCSIGCANFINFLRGKGLKKMIMVDAFGFNIDAFNA